MHKDIIVLKALSNILEWILEGGRLCNYHLRDIEEEVNRLLKSCTLSQEDVYHIQSREINRFTVAVIPDAHEVKEETRSLRMELYGRVHAACPDFCDTSREVQLEVLVNILLYRLHESSHHHVD